MRHAFHDHLPLAGDLETEQGRRGIERHKVYTAAQGALQRDGERRLLRGVEAAHAQVDIASGVSRATRSRAKKDGQAKVRLRGQCTAQRVEVHGHEYSSAT